MLRAASDFSLSSSFSPKAKIAAIANAGSHMPATWKSDNTDRVWSTEAVQI